jgi:hypothetical protein
VTHMPPDSIFVLGMDRGGTSAVTRGLLSLGVELGDRFKASDQDNPSGYWENDYLLAINRRLMHALGLKWHSIALIESDRWQLPPIQAIESEAVGTIRKHFGSVPLWGFKDPRTIRVLPFWRTVLRRVTVNECYVVVVRNPLSVALSLRKAWGEGMALEKLGLLWLVHMVPHFYCIRDRPFVVVDYDSVITDPLRQFTRIASILGLRLDSHHEAELERYAKEFLTQNLRHSQFTEQDLAHDVRLGELCRDAFRWLCRLARDEIHPQAPQFWEDWQRIEHTLRALAPAWRYLDELDGTIGELRARVETVSTQINILRGSTSWRITRPLRAIRHIIRRNGEPYPLDQLAGASLP